MTKDKKRVTYVDTKNVSGTNQLGHKKAKKDGTFVLNKRFYANLFISNLCSM